MAANTPVVMDQRLHQEMDRMEMELEMEMEMMEQQSNPFHPMGRNNLGGGSRGMMGRRDDFMDGGNRGMMMGGMRGGRKSGGGFRKPGMDSDMDYMEYTDDLQNMAVAMDNKFMKGMSPMGGMNRGRGGVHGRLGQRGGPTRGRASFPPTPNLGGRGTATNPLFDDLYQPKFKSKNEGDRNNLFEKARSKLSASGPGS